MRWSNDRASYRPEQLVLSGTSRQLEGGVTRMGLVILIIQEVRLVAVKRKRWASARRDILFGGVPEVVVVTPGYAGTFSVFLICVICSHCGRILLTLRSREAERIRERAVRISHLQAYGLAVVDELAGFIGNKQRRRVRVVVDSLFLLGAIHQ